MTKTERVMVAKISPHSKGKWVVETFCEPLAENGRYVKYVNAVEIISGKKNAIHSVTTGWPGRKIRWRWSEPNGKGILYGFLTVDR